MLHSWKFRNRYGRTYVDKFFAEKVVGWYSKTKAMATQAVLDAVKKEGLNACVVHPSGILGPQDYAVGETTGTIIKIINGEMPIGMGGSFNLCDVRDLAAGCTSPRLSLHQTHLPL